jgi:hypothetical protein
MRVAVDVQFSDDDVADLERAGVKVSVRAEHGEPDPQDKCDNFPSCNSCGPQRQ